MRQKKPANPFLTIGYHSPEYFCDRDMEISRLLLNLESGNNTTLVSIRRMGKTGLIKHLFYQLPAEWKGIYVDILATENLSQFLNVLSTSIINTIPEKKSYGSKILDFIKTLRPVISYDPLTNTPQISFDAGQKETENNILSILRYLDVQNFRVVIAIDEFQQIVNYPEKQALSWLRGVVQEMINVRFVFSGSRQHIMNELFTSPAKPFYRSSLMMALDKIDHQVYADFIEKQFSAHSKEIPREVVQSVLKWTNGHTYYVQLLCNRVFAQKQRKITDEVWKAEAYILLKEEELFFINYRNILTKQQWRLFRSIAREGETFKPTSKEFISRNKLGSPSTVLRSLNALMRNELLYKGFTDDGSSFYSVYDVLFQRWAENV